MCSVNTSVKAMQCAFVALGNVNNHDFAKRKHWYLVV